MWSKVEKPAAVPAKYLEYRPADWPGGHGDWIAAREKWNGEQEPVMMAGVSHDGRGYVTRHGPLGDLTDLIRARREARAIDWARAYTQA